jgi:hypothetical protein
MSKTKLSVSFSGGRTSAFMSKWLIDNKSDEFDMQFVFANTGQEHEKTLEFVDRCDKAFGLNLTWVEAVVHHGERKGSTHKVVNYETAARNGEPFEEVIKKYGIPNSSFLHCNREMKLNPMNSWRKENHADSLFAIGIRNDEIDRMRPDYEKAGLIYPLISMRPTTKSEILNFWSKQSFDLDLPEHLGNCITCYKKTDRKLMTIAKHEPWRFDFFKRMEEKYSFAGAGNGERKFFRKHRSCSDIIASSKEPFNEFVDHKPEYQPDLFGLDQSNGCSESCEAFAE